MEFQKRVLLLMNYNNSKTLNENTQSLLTESVVEPVTKILRNLVGLADNELSKVINKTKPELQTLLNSSRRTADQIDDLFKSIVNPKSLAQTLIDTKGLLNNIQLGNTIDTFKDIIVQDPKKYSKLAKSISDSLMSTLNLPPSAKNLLDEYSQIIKTKIKNKIRVENPDVYIEITRKGGGLAKKLSKLEAKNLKPKTIKWWEWVLSNDYTIFDVGRGWLNEAVNRIRLAAQKEDKFIDDVFAKLRRAMDESVDKYKRGEKIDTALYQNINVNLRVLSEKNKALLDGIYDDLGELLKQKYPDNVSEVNDLIAQVKKNDPFKSGRIGALTQFLDSTASSKYLGNFRKMFFGPEKSKNLLEFGERTFYLMTTGFPKTTAEWGAYKMQGLLGPLNLYKDMWIALHVGMPMALSAAATVANMVHIVGFGNPEKVEGPLQDWYSRWLQHYKKMGTGWHAYDVYLPVHPYIKDIYDFSKEVYAEKYTNLLEKAIIPFLEEYSDEQLSKMPGYDSTKSREENIKNIAKAYKDKALSDIKNIPTPPVPIVDIDIQKDVKPVVPCLFEGGWTVDLTILNGAPKYVTHNADWSEKYYLDVNKKDNVTTVYYQGTTQNPCK
jgi:hypothetical protein